VITIRTIGLVIKSNIAIVCTMTHEGMVGRAIALQAKNIAKNIICRDEIGHIGSMS
jgi:hypothetical protein